MPNDHLVFRVIVACALLASGLPAPAIIGGIVALAYPWERHVPPAPPALREPDWTSPSPPLTKLSDSALPQPPSPKELPMPSAIETGTIVTWTRYPNEMNMAVLVRGKVHTLDSAHAQIEVIDNVTLKPMLVRVPLKELRAGWN